MMCRCGKKPGSMLWRYPPGEVYRFRYSRMRRKMRSCIDTRSMAARAFRFARTDSGTLRIMTADCFSSPSSLWILAAQSWGQDMLDPPTRRAYTPAVDNTTFPYVPAWCFAGCSYNPIDFHLSGMVFSFLPGAGPGVLIWLIAFGKKPPFCIKTIGWCFSLNILTRVGQEIDHHLTDRLIVFSYVLSFKPFWSATIDPLF